MKLRKLLILFTACLCGTRHLAAQNTFPSSGPVGIGTANPSNGAILEIVAPSSGPGTISVTGSSGTVTGTGTSFAETFSLGDQIVANGETHTVSSIASDTSMTTDSWTSTFGKPRR